MAFSPERLIIQLSEIRKTLGDVRRFWVAYSGGMDSHVLLHALARIYHHSPTTSADPSDLTGRSPSGRFDVASTTPAPSSSLSAPSNQRLDTLATNSGEKYGLASVRSEIPDIEIFTLHIHHGLHVDADKWQAHCVSVCQALSIPIKTVTVNAQPKAGESPEAAARDARYQAMESFIQAGDCLLTAHHRDDQAETVLLQLLRGSGPRGLAAMPVDASFGKGWHVRPLLQFTRAELLDYAQQQSLEWIEDSSNTDTRFDRNFIRHEVMPSLKTRWPAAASTISRVAVHSAEASKILDEVARTDLLNVRLQQTGQLSVSTLKLLTGPRIRNCLRGWLQELNLPLPSTAQMERVIEDVLDAAPDANPTVHWSGAEIRRYRDVLFAMKPLSTHDATQVLNWDCRQPLSIPGLSYSLRALPVTGKGLQANLCLKEGVQVKFRHGGEVCRPAGRGHTHSVKKLMQEFGIPPWERNRIPMLHLGGQLAAVGSMWVCEGFQAVEGEEGLVFEYPSYF